MLVVQLFAALAAGAWYFLWMQKDNDDLHQVFSQHCPVDINEGLGLWGARQAYTGVGPIDDIACLLVTFFTPLLVPANHFLRTALLALPAAWFPVLVDSASLFPNNPLLAIGIPLIDGFVVQLKGGGVGLPLYWLMSHVTRSRLRAEGGVPKHADSQAVLAAFLATVIGAVIPTVVLVVNPEIPVIALWQLFPIYVAVGQALLLLVLPSQHSSKSKEAKKSARKSQDSSVVTTTRLAWAVLALIPTYSYYTFLSTAFQTGDPLSYIKSVAHATSGIYNYETLEDLLRTGLQDETHRFILWDIAFIGAASWLGGAFSGASDTFGQFLLLVAASVVGTAAFGPGVLIATPFLYGLSRDEKKRPVQSTVDEKKTK